MKWRELFAKSYIYTAYILIINIIIVCFLIKNCIADMYSIPAFLNAAIEPLQPHKQGCMFDDSVEIVACR